MRYLIVLNVGQPTSGASVLADRPAHGTTQPGNRGTTSEDGGKEDEGDAGDAGGEDNEDEDESRR